MSLSFSSSSHSSSSSSNSLITPSKSYVNDPLYIGDNDSNIDDGKTHKRRRQAIHQASIIDLADEKSGPDPAMLQSTSTTKVNYKDPILKIFVPYIQKDVQKAVHTHVDLLRTIKKREAELVKLRTNIAEGTFPNFLKNLPTIQGSSAEQRYTDLANQVFRDARSTALQHILAGKEYAIKEAKDLILRIPTTLADDLATSLAHLDDPSTTHLVIKDKVDSYHLEMKKIIIIHKLKEKEDKEKKDKEQREMEIERESKLENVKETVSDCIDAKIKVLFEKGVLIPGPKAPKSYLKVSKQQQAPQQPPAQQAPQPTAGGTRNQNRSNSNKNKNKNKSNSSKNKSKSNSSKNKSSSTKEKKKKKKKGGKKKEEEKEKEKEEGKGKGKGKGDKGKTKDQ